MLAIVRTPEYLHTGDLPVVVARSIPATHRATSKAWYENPKEETARLRAAIAAALE